MSGHFVLWKISVEDKDHCLAGYAGSQWSALQHAAVGWTAASRAVLGNVKANVAIPNRAGLPPHRYLMLGPDNPLTLPLKTYLHGRMWVRDLVRSDDAGFALTALCATARGFWDEGKKVDALMAQIEFGGTSVEIYYLGKNEMT